MKRRAPMKRGGPLKRKGRHRVKTREVDEVYLEWIRSLPCLVRGRTYNSGNYILKLERTHVCYGVTEPHHVKTRATGGSDYQTVPLCSGAHRMGDTIGWQSFQRAFAVDLTAEAARLADTYTKEKAA